MKSYLFTIIIISLVACKKSTNEPQPRTPVTLEEIKTLTPMTIDQIEKAYKYVVQENPTLVQDSVNLSRAVFNRLKSNPNGRLENLSSPTRTASLFTISSQLSSEEILLILKHILYVVEFKNAVNDALSKAAQEFPCDEDVGFTDGKADAVRHAYWNALMVKHIGINFAKDFATAHEKGDTLPDNLMDLHNNEFGRVLALKYHTATDAQLLEILVEQKFLYVAPFDTIPANAMNALVYINAKRRYDGTLTGTLTNPDSGTTWAVSFDINQCDDIIRGQYTVVSGKSFQKRRFSGKIELSNSIILDVSDPYTFENPENLGFCTEVKVTLTGNENSLSGNWTSSSCHLGGKIKVVR